MKLPVIGKPSTRDWIAEARSARKYSLFDFIHGYIYARWPYFYISVGTGEHPLTRYIAPVGGWLIERLTPKKKGQSANPGTPEKSAGQHFADTYHGKVVPLEAAKQLVQVREDIRFTDLEKIVPYSRARDIILHHPDHIVAMECPCRAARANPCLPMDVCLIIGEPFAGFIMEHQEKRARRITSDEAVEILKAENDRGHVHHAFFKDAMLGRFYAICNCCDCCCGAMQAQRNGTPMLASSGYQAVLDADLCAGCGSCENLCQFHAVFVGEDGIALVDGDKCMGCGVCANHCPTSALTLERVVERGEPLEIQKLMENSLRIL